jgi:predicted GNAT family acetyltransferase
MATEKKQTSIYLEAQDEQNISIIMRKTALKRQNDIVLYALRHTAECLTQEKKSNQNKGYFDEKAFEQFVELMLANGLEVDMIKDIALKNVEKLITQALKKYNE